MMTLKEWSELSGMLLTHPTTERNAVSIAIGGESEAEHRSMLWNLSDFVVSSASFMVVWLVRR